MRTPSDQTNASGRNFPFVSKLTSLNSFNSHTNLPHSRIQCIIHNAMLYALWFCYHILQYECMFSFASVLLNRKIVHATASDSHCHIYTFNCIRHWYYCFFSSTIFIPFFPLYLTIFDFIDIGGFCWFYYYYYNFLFPFRCVHKINESIVMFREVFVRPQRQWRRPRRRWRRFLCVFLCESKRPPRLAQSQIPLLFCVCSWVWEYHVQCPVCGCVSFVIANIIAFTSQPPVNHGMDSLTQRTIVSPHLESNSNEQ